MTRLLTAITVLAPAAAYAHPGHLDTAGGHSHWEMLAGLMVLVLAGGAALYAARR